VEGSFFSVANMEAKLRRQSIKRKPLTFITWGGLWWFGID
jgi:hypothetical protein